jgi:hypothetical protein
MYVKRMTDRAIRRFGRVRLSPVNGMESGLFEEEVRKGEAEPLGVVFRNGRCHNGGREHT